LRNCRLEIEGVAGREPSAASPWRCATDPLMPRRPDAAMRRPEGVALGIARPTGATDGVYPRNPRKPAGPFRPPPPPRFCSI